MQAIFSFDEKIFQWLNGFAGKSIMFDFFVFFSAEYIIFLLALGTILFILKKTKEEEFMAVIAFLGVIIGRVIFTPLIRFLFFRPRPFLDGEVIQLISKDPSEASFPSGHTVLMFALAFAVFKRHKGWGSFMLVLAFVSGISRVISGVHYPLDIFAGIVIGFIAFITAGKIIKIYRHHLKRTIWKSPKN